MSKFNVETMGNNLMKVSGHIEFHLLDMIKSKNLTKYSLAKLTNIRYDTICNYCSGNVTLINVEYLKIFCYVLECEISDIIKYTPE